VDETAIHAIGSTVLDTALLFDAIPQRYGDLGLTGLDTSFAMARGRESVGAPATPRCTYFGSSPVSSGLALRLVSRFW
jgi:hypothetical protein